MLMPRGTALTRIARRFRKTEGEARMTLGQGKAAVSSPGVARVLPVDRPEAAHRIRRSIERTLHSRVASRGTAAARIEAVAKQKGERVWVELKRHPSLGIVAAAGLGFAAVTVVGVGELAFAIATGYAAYQVLKEGVPLAQALGEEAKRMVD